MRGFRRFRGGRCSDGWRCYPGLSRHLARTGADIAQPLTLTGVERNGKNAAVAQPAHVVVNTDFAGAPTAALFLVTDTSDVTIENVTVMALTVAGSAIPLSRAWMEYSSDTIRGGRFDGGDEAVIGLQVSTENSVQHQLAL